MSIGLLIGTQCVEEGVALCWRGLGDCSTLSCQDLNMKSKATRAFNSLIKTSLI